MTYPLILIYIVMTAATLGIVFLIGFMILNFLAPLISSWFEAQEQLQKGQTE